MLPVAFEDRSELVDNVGVSGARYPDIPFQPSDLGGVGEV